MDRLETVRYTVLSSVDNDFVKTTGSVYRLHLLDVLYQFQSLMKSKLKL